MRLSLVKHLWRPNPSRCIWSVVLGLAVSQIAARYPWNPLVDRQQMRRETRRVEVNGRSWVMNAQSTWGFTSVMSGVYAPVVHDELLKDGEGDDRDAARHVGGWLQDEVSALIGSISSTDVQMTDTMRRVTVSGVALGVPCDAFYTVWATGTDDAGNAVNRSVGMIVVRKTMIPAKPRWRGLIANLAVWSTVVYLASGAVTGWRVSRRRGRGLCIVCSYDLAGCTTELCPECGSKVGEV